MAKNEKLVEINSLEEIPEFESEAEEAEFWATHSFGDGLLERMKPIPEEGSPRKRAVKLTADLSERLEAEEEKREGII